MARQTESSSPMSQASAMLLDGDKSHENSSIDKERRIHVSVETPHEEIVEAAARQFLDRLLARDAASWEFLVAEYGPRLRGLGRFYRLSTQDTEDALQSAWFSVLTHAGEIRDPLCLGGWLTSTMRRACLKALASARKRPVPVGDWTPYEARWHDDEDTDSTLDAIDHDRQAAPLRGVVGTFSPRPRTLARGPCG